MRKNTAKVLEAALKGKPCRPCESIWTNGHAIFSYYTQIAYSIHGKWMVTERKYSATTSKHTNGIVEGLTRAGYVVGRYF
jgi:hypothetical protein